MTRIWLCFALLCSLGLSATAQTSPPNIPPAQLPPPLPFILPLPQPPPELPPQAQPVPPNAEPAPLRYSCPGGDCECVGGGSCPRRSPFTCPHSDDCHSSLDDAQQECGVFAFRCGVLLPR
jgi:hypothetical protein